MKKKNIHMAPLLSTIFIKNAMRLSCHAAFAYSLPFCTLLYTSQAVAKNQATVETTTLSASVIQASKDANENTVLNSNSNANTGVDKKSKKKPLLYRQNSNQKDDEVREQSAESAGLALNILAAELMNKDQPVEVWENYMVLAQKYQTPWFARRAYEVALQLKESNQIKASLELWQKLEEKTPNIEAEVQKSKNLYSKSDDMQKYLARKIDLNKQLTLQAFQLRQQPEAINYLQNYLLFSRQLLDYNLKRVDYKYKNNTELAAAEIDKLKITEKNKEQEKTATQILEIETWVNQHAQGDSAYLKAVTPKIIEQLNTLPQNWQIAALKITLLQKIDINQARAEAQKMREIYPNTYELELTNILLKDPVTRTHELAGLTQKKPEERRSQILYLTNLFALGRLEEAKNHINSILQRDEYRQDFEIHFLLAQIYRVQQQPEKAVALIEDLAASTRNLPDALYLFMHDVLRSSNHLEDGKKALEWLEKANLNREQRMRLVADYLKDKNFSAANNQLNLIEKDLNAADKILFLNYSADLWIFYQQNNYAIQQIEKIIVQQPKNHQAHMVLANLYIKDNKIQSAIPILEKAIAIDPQNPTAYNFLAYLYAENSTDTATLNQGIEYAEKALKIEANSGIYQDTLGWLYFKKKDLRNAKVWLEKAWMNEKEIEIGTHLLETYDGLGMYEEAQALKIFLLEFMQKTKANYQKDLAILENMLKIQAEQNQRENEAQEKKDAQPKNSSPDSLALQAIEKIKNLRGQIAFKTTEQIQALQKKQIQMNALEKRLQDLIGRLKK